MKKRKLTPKEQYKINTAGTPDYIYVMWLLLIALIVLIAVTYVMVNYLEFGTQVLTTLAPCRIATTRFLGCIT